MSLVKNSSKKHILNMAVIAGLFLLATAIVYQFGVLELQLWFFYLPGFGLATALYKLMGSVIYTFSMAVAGMAMFYITGSLNRLSSAEESSSMIYSFLFLIFNLMLIGVLFSLRVKKLKQDDERAKETLLVDQLTGLRNYGYFMGRLEEERRRADKEDYELSLIMIDIDYFKEFNDRFGHLRGNELIKEISKILEQNVRSHDIVCRYGGEEFAIILPRTTLNEAKEVAERVRKAVESRTFYGNRAFPNVKRTISCGVASYPGQASDEYELIDMADRALYYAKETGRNKSVVYSEEVERKWFKGISEEL